MTTVDLILYQWKTLHNGQHPILIRITKFRKVKYIALGKSSSKELWNEKKNRPSVKHSSAKELTILIENRLKEINKLVDRLEAENPNISAEDIRTEYFVNLKKNRYNLLKYFDVVVDRLTTSERLGYADVFRSTKNSLKNFLKEKDLEFASIGHSFLVKYENYLRDRKVMPNTAFVYLRTFKTLINYAKSDQLVSTDYNPFRDFNLAKFRNIKTKKRAITKDEMLAIKALEIDTQSRLYNSRNFFLFSFYCRGINFIDIAHLKWTNINDGRLIYRRKKTNDLFTIQLLPPALEIINVYEKAEDPDGYIFPILDSEKHKSAISIDNRIHKVLRHTNSDLKQLGEKAEIKIPITTYVARHTYATVLKRAGVSTTVISEELGHSDERTTQIYLDSLGNSTLDQADLHLL